jgi:orotidine-5'-phosphate decarboxylase
MAEIIIALDLPGDEARRLLDRVPEARWVKVGSVLFTREGPGLARDLVARGLSVFLDLKWHDIPNTVAGSVEAASGLGAAMATVHTLGGVEMLKAAAAAAGPRLGLVGVTVLTSHSRESFATAVGRQDVVLLDEVARLAESACSAGLRGVVCSPLEVRTVRPRLPREGWVVVPGIRRTGDPAGDQVRTASPGEAAKSGATHLVVGRPILAATDPRAVYLEMAAQAGEAGSWVPTA